MAIATKLRQFLDENRIRYVTLLHSPAFTAQEAAATLHVPGRQFAKAVLLKTKKTYIMAVLEAPDHLDLTRLEKLTRKKHLTMAEESEIETLFPDCEVGAMPPFGNLYKLPVFADRKLEEDDEIVFNAGNHREAVRMKYVDFKSLVKPKVGTFARA